jgi:hypothetical protein
MTNPFTPIASRATLGDQLRRKSRSRREGQERVAIASATHRRRNDVLPRLGLSYVPLEELRPSARKLRKLDPAHVREVASSISLLGFCDPLLIAHGNELIDGEARYAAAKQLGLDRVPCVRVEHLNPDEQRVLRLAVNRLAEKGQWDLEALKIEFEELILLDAPIEITGFSPAEIDMSFSVTPLRGSSRGRSSQIQPLRSPGWAICFNSVRIASFAATRPIPRFLLDCWKAMSRPVSS